MHKTPKSGNPNAKKIGVIGAGYVGLVTGACLAELGHYVTCADIDLPKIQALELCKMPYYEEGLEDLVRRGLGQRRLNFTADIAGAIQKSEVIFIAVGTPPNDDGSPDVRALYQVVDTIAREMRGPATVVIKSTVPVGTAQKVRSAIAAEVDFPIAVLSNPEFLREGRSIEDFMYPSRVVIGADKREQATLLHEIYADFVPEDRILVLDNRSAEMSKYASNAFLATKISFVNEMADLCEALGADVELVRRVVGMDPRIGHGHLAPGIGYGGSCLPKDVQAVLHMAEEAGRPLDLLSAVQQINAERPDRLVQQMRDYFGGNLAGRRIAIWGLAFKPGTDDVRGAPSLSIISLLLRAGAEVIAYDPGANDKVRATLNGLIQYASDQYECIEKADALVVATEWEQFRHPDWGRLALAMKAPVIFDGRNIYDPEDMASKGFAYFGVGRSVVRPSALGGPGEPQIGVHGGSIGTVQERLRPVLGLETGSGFEGISQGHQRKGS